MAEIPRFYAQISQVSVPRMKDYEYEENRSIYETMKKAGEQISNTFFEIVAEGSLPFQQGGAAKKAATKTDQGEKFKQYEISKGVNASMINVGE